MTVWCDDEDSPNKKKLQRRILFFITTGCFGISRGSSQHEAAAAWNSCHVTTLKLADQWTTGKDGKVNGRR